MDRDQGMAFKRASLFYLAGYLAATGVALLAAPEQALRLLMAQRSYDPTFVSFTGAFMLALSTLVVQIIRLHIHQLYPTTIGVRLFFIACILRFYRQTGDRLWLVILAVVGLGVLLTTTGFLLDRRAKRATEP
jgi:predicted ABC-type sugar transport system permease subunit